MFELKGKVIVLTGATGALGSALALSLAKAEAKLVILGRNQALMDALVDQLSAFTTAVAYAVDVMNRDDLMRVRKQIVGTFQRIDVLINAVGGNLPGAVIPDDQSIFNLSVADFDQVVDLNLKGTLLPSIVFGEVMSQQKKGSIINYS